ncbi:hypothetical protein AGABI1DRAFT_133687 [Agaricus bisporus var. burnettii JB137-S8]|uniref:Uncharacterized protein n=1 Tax=Agaricus bisporus var. burnettii (strain JB137-S8 / ATCC MYA-4627 / FGSC 10392) TaxID=597362 RepID=K5XHY7_AGABU|nr:uncharacterized protein AGABI1DRAFT_133687 [Agaricus bisporus var. burnettii JB137-S8]EKM74055.1 hypothetical protein AGABI1DRAFT_133687 [Agaricus bisporus var. burnettii JB137-S8]
MATAADVYVFFHAFLALTIETLEEGMVFEIEEKTENRSILEWQHNQLFGNENMASDLYILEIHITNALFKCQLMQSNHSDYTGIHNLAAFKRVANFLLNIAEKEIKHGHKPELIVSCN